MSSLSTSDEEPETHYNARFSMSTVGDHTRRSQNSKHAHRHYVRSWVEEQRKELMISELNESSVIPAIIVTDADQEESTPMELLPFPNPPGNSGSPMLSTVGHKLPQSPLSSGARRASLYPSMINEPILEEDNEEDTEITEGVGDTAITSGAQNLHAKSAIHANEPVEELPSLLAFDRKRAKSYPSEIPSEPLALLELPKQPQPIEEEEEEEENGTNVKPFSLGIRKFAHVAVMAKKWKKRSSQEESCLGQQAKESVAGRQRKRQYIEIPRALKLEIYEEAIPLVQKTYQMYKSCLGPKHKLTLLTEQHLQHLATQLGNKPH